MNHFTCDLPGITLLISFDASLKIVTAVEEIIDEFMLSRRSYPLTNKYRTDEQFRAQCDKELREYLILLDDDKQFDAQLMDYDRAELELYADDNYKEEIS